MPKTKRFSKEKVTIFVVVLAAVGILGVGLWFLGSRMFNPEPTGLNEEMSLEEIGLQQGRQQVRRVLLKRRVNGVIEYIEILANGQLCTLDEQMQPLKCSRMGIAQLRSLFLDIENRLGKEPGKIWGGFGAYELWVETEAGTTVIGGGGEDDDWDDIVDNIDDIEDQVFTPTPTLFPSPTINLTVVPSATPFNFYPSPTINFGPSPTPGGPTPLPAYMTAPPFTCEEYEYLNRPITISNVICGAD